MIRFGSTTSQDKNIVEAHISVSLSHIECHIFLYLRWLIGRKHSKEEKMPFSLCSLDGCSECSVEKNINSFSLYKNVSHNNELPQNWS